METVEATVIDDKQRILKAVQKDIAMTYRDHPATVVHVKSPSMIRLSRSGTSISVETSIRSVSPSGLGIGSPRYVVEVKVSRAFAVFDMERLKSIVFYAVVVSSAFGAWLLYKGVDPKGTFFQWVFPATIVQFLWIMILLTYRAKGSLTAFPESEIADLRKKLNMRARDAMDSIL